MSAMWTTKMILTLIAPFLLTTTVSAEEPESYILFACTQHSDTLDKNSPLNVLIVKQESDNFSPQGILNGTYPQSEGLVFSFRHYTAVMDKDERLSIHKIREIEQLEPERSYTLDDGRIFFSSIGFDTDKTFDDGKETRINFDTSHLIGVQFSIKSRNNRWMAYYGYRCDSSGGPFVIHNKQRKSSVTYDESEWYEANKNNSNASSGSVY